MANIKRNRGFTIVELLVVIAIISMLVAILLPAVNAAREAARNTQCKNRIRNLATAANAFEVRMQKYPGFVNAIDSDVKTISWVVQLSPDLEQKDVYDGWRQWTRDSGVPPPTPAMPIVECPSDATVREGAGTSMVANAGIADTNWKLNRPENGVFLDRSDPKNSPANNADFISQNDGASSTLMFSENYLATTWDARGTFEKPDKMSNVFVWHDRSNPAPEMLINGGLKNMVILTRETARPSSFHPGGVNVAFCDGHVQFLRDDITYPVYVQLMTPFGKHCDFTEGTLLPLAATDYE